MLVSLKPKSITDANYRGSSFKQHGDESKQQASSNTAMSRFSTPVAQEVGDGREY